MVMEQLQKLDQVAYVRFASVYRQFKDISQFIRHGGPAQGAAQGRQAQGGRRAAAPAAAVQDEVAAAFRPDA